MADLELRQATTDAEIDRCFPVLVQLRPQLARPLFVARIRAQMASGYHLAFAAERATGTVRAVAGYRYGENLAWGRHLYVDDLVSDAEVRGKGCASALFEWLVAEARGHGCVQFHLDSGVQRFDAHRFYLGKGMRLSSHHFVLDVAPPTSC